MHDGEKLVRFRNWPMGKEKQFYPIVQRYWDSFIRNANMQMRHPNDWDRYYQFVRNTHRCHIRFSPYDLCDILRESGFDEEYGVKLSDIYYDGRRILGSDQALLWGGETRGWIVKKEAEQRLREIKSEIDSKTV